MGKERVKFSDEIRQAIEASGLSRYAICKELKIEPAQMSRFMAGTGWIGQDKLDALAERLELHAIKRKRKRTK